MTCDRRARTCRSAFILVAMTAAVLSGCAPTPPATTAPTGGGESSSPTASAAPSDRPTADPTDPSAWTITEAGVGPIEIGGNLDSTLSGLAGEWTNDANCAWTAWWLAPDSSYGVSFSRGPEDAAAPISEISVYTGAEDPVPGAGPVTAEGLGIGAARSQILAAYPDAVEGSQQIGGGTWIRVGEGDARVFFEFRQGSEKASDVVVTTRSEPSYEVCG